MQVPDRASSRPDLVVSFRGSAGAESTPQRRALASLWSNTAGPVVKWPASVKGQSSGSSTSLTSLKSYVPMLVTKCNLASSHYAIPYKSVIRVLVRKQDLASSRALISSSPWSWPWYSSKTSPHHACSFYLIVSDTATARPDSVLHQKSS